MKTVTCKNNTMIIPKTAYISLSQLSDADLGKYIRMIFDYGFSDIEPEVSPLENAMLAPIFDFIKNSKDSYDKVSESRKKAANARWNKQMDADNANACECMQVDANDALNNNINKNNNIDRNRNIDSNNTTNNDNKLVVPSEQLSIIQQLSKTFDKVKHGNRVFSDNEIYQYAKPLLGCGWTADELCIVIEWCDKAWSDQARINIGPKGCFNTEKFANRLAKAQADKEANNIDVSRVYRLYEHLELNPPEKLTEWCIKTLRENPDMNVNSLVVAIHRMYFELKESNNREWLQNKLGSTNKLTELLPKHKALAIELQDMADDIPHLAI